ncbi:unnamed protein product [Prorocentrum cordatum]|uniref:Reverse transcriptase domain-containing protein n=1 Tax=Prorocentrum cordatum TaxID=2364126 RepID=A0ABN9TSC0_9DINO|nr:unnamed protein product [Polarella glacialis]
MGREAYDCNTSGRTARERAADCPRYHRRHKVSKATRKLKQGRAGRMGSITPEFWREACEDGTPTLQWITRFCNMVWETGRVPDAWHRSKVRMIYKSDDHVNCNTCCPITVLPIGYNVFALVLPHRLKDAGAEQRMWNAHFGFRSNGGTPDAIFIARRVLERTWSSRDSKAVFPGVGLCESLRLRVPRSTC